MDGTQDRTLCQKVILGVAKPTVDDVLEGEALPGTHNLEELINDVYRKEKGEDLARVETLRDLANQSDRDAIAGEPDAFAGG